MAMRIVAISGSLRAASCNSGLVRCAKALAPAGVEIVQANINLPLFSQDLEREPPESVTQFYDLIASADAILFATPEHNYQVPAAMKNALDWGSRRFVNGVGPSNIFFDKPAALMSAGGGSGGQLAQLAIRQSGVFLNLHILNKPEVQCRIFGPVKVFDPATGDVIDQTTQGKVKELVDALVAWTHRISLK